MSYSLREPDWPDVCECVYDETRDEMDRENCPLHYDFVDESSSDSAALERKQATITTHTASEAAA